MSWNEGLEGPYLEIASTTRTPLRVIAGPGTGKTYALIRRVARLLEEGCDPQRILLVTFTRVSADDLEKELNKLKIHRGEQVLKGTLHSICFSILHREHVLDITHRIARPLLDYEERYLLEDLSLVDGFGTIHQRRRRLKAFEAAWAREQTQQPGIPISQEDLNFQFQLVEWLKFHKAMLIGELVSITLNFLRINPLCDELSQFEHVLVDEYQDLNRAEQSLIDLLASHGSLSIVGDQDQAIYEQFRYAHPEGIAQFHEIHTDTCDVPLDISRRCSSSIVTIANSLIRNNSQRSPRQLILAQNELVTDIDLVQWTDMDSESNGIANYISKKIDDGEFDIGQILILCPRRQFGYMIRDSLNRFNKTAVSFFNEESLDGDPKLLESCYAQQAFTVFTLLVHNRDVVALRTWLGFGNSTLRKREYARIRAYCAQSGLSPFDVFEALVNGNLSIPHTIGITGKYRELQHLLAELNSLSINDALRLIFPANNSWADPFSAIIDQIEDFSDLSTIYDQILTSITQPELPTDANYIRIMSLYKSKGLTSDHVFILGCNEGLIPSYPIQQLSFNDEIRFKEEQRRLFYVAITRAKRTLIISSISRIPKNFAYRMRVPVIDDVDPSLGNTISSTFLNELGDTCPHSRRGSEWLENVL
jgi:DNA helicase II / ATP-dependent DNA helicase PcrA